MEESVWDFVLYLGGLKTGPRKKEGGARKEREKDTLALAQGFTAKR